MTPANPQFRALPFIAPLMALRMAPRINSPAPGMTANVLVQPMHLSPSARPITAPPSEVS